MAKLVTALVVAGTLGTASANTVIATDASASPPESASTHTIEARIGGLLGGADVGDADGLSAGITLGVGYRIDDLMIRALFDYYRVGDAVDESAGRNGRATRIGAAVRHDFARTDEKNDIAAAFWGELGGGYEHVAWRHGGVLDRPTMQLGFGFDFGHRDTHSRHPHKELGFYTAMRAQLGLGPETMAPATCGGPCDEPTQPSRLDVTMFWELGVQWAK